MKINSKIKYGASALALGLILASCSGEDVKNTADKAQTTIEEKAESTENAIEEKTDDVKEAAKDKANDLKAGLEDKSFAISMDDAVAKFRETFSDSAIEVSSVALDEEDGKYVYDIEGFTKSKEYEARIDAESGEVIGQEEDDDEKDDDDIAIDFTKIASPEEAMSKALENNKGYVTSYDLDHDDDDGRIVYDIDVEGGDDVELDAETLDILEK